MGLVREDRVKDKTTTTGTGTITLSGTTETGFRTFASALADGDTVRYLIVLGSEWEFGEGVFTASGSTLTRPTIFSSSNAGAAVNFSAGTKDVSIVIGARDLEELEGVGLVSPCAGRTAPLGTLLCDGAAYSRATYANLFNYIVPSLGTFTITIAAPGVVTLTGHGLLTGDQVYLTTTGALPTGLSANTIYWITKIDNNSFKLATSLANAKASTNITTTGTQSGTHTARFCPWGLGDGSTTFNVPNIKGRIIVGQDTADTAFNLINVPDTYIGEKTHVLSIAELPTIDMDSYKTDPTHAHTTPFSNGDQDGSGSNGTINGGATATSSASTGITFAPFGSGTAHNNVQPYTVMPYVIKY
jgi:microcystin-dependent protein